MHKPLLDRHISERLNQNIAEIFNHILEMGKLVETQFEKVMKALNEGEIDNAHEIIELDKKLNSAEYEIGRLCSSILARQQLNSTDIRFVLASIRIAIDLERMGDELLKVARMIIVIDGLKDMNLSQLPGHGALDDIGSRTIVMLKTYLYSFENFSLKSAEEIIQEEEQIDDIYKQAVDEVKNNIKTFGENFECLTQILSALRAVERTSDHIRNLTESMIYFISGEDIRGLEAVTLKDFFARVQNEY